MSVFNNTPAMLLALLLSTPALAQTATPPGNAAHGKFAFLQCQACHAVTANAPPNIGPTLFGIYNKQAASQPGYDYSNALKAAKITWTAQALDTWITSPGAMVPGTKMAFIGIADPTLRANIIAYLATLR